MVIIEIEKEGDTTLRINSQASGEFAVRGLDAARALMYALEIGDGDLCAHGFSKDGCDFVWERFGVVMRAEDHGSRWWVTIHPAEQAAREPYTRPVGLIGEVRA